MSFHTAGVALFYANKTSSLTDLVPVSSHTSRVPPSPTCIHSLPWSRHLSSVQHAAPHIFWNFTETPGCSIGIKCDTVKLLRRDRMMYSRRPYFFRRQQLCPQSSQGKKKRRNQHLRERTARNHRYGGCLNVFNDRCWNAWVKKSNVGALFSLAAVLCGCCNLLQHRKELDLFQICSEQSAFPCFSQATPRSSSDLPRNEGIKTTFWSSGAHALS